MSKESSFSRESFAHAGMALALCIGTAACTPLDRRPAVTYAIPTPSPTPSVTTESTPVCFPSLELFSVSLVTQSGSAYATNEGSCVNIYAHELEDTLGSIGQIPTNGKFYIKCYDLAVPALRVTVGRSSEGILDLSGYALRQLDEDPDARQIRTC